MCFGIGNGTAFVPLTGAPLAGMRQGDASAASSVVNADLSRRTNDPLHTSDDGLDRLAASAGTARNAPTD